MDIEMIRFTGLLSIMLIIEWIIITAFFIIADRYANKDNKGDINTDEEQMKCLNENEYKKEKAKKKSV